MGTKLAAATYVQINRNDLEEWLDHLPAHGKWHQAPGRVGIYLIPLSDSVAVKLSSTIGSSNDAMGRGMASMQLSLVSLITGQTLNKKAQGQGHFKRTTNWKTTWAKGFDLMKDAYVKAQGFYDAIAGIQDREQYKTDIVKKIEAVPNWRNDNLLTDFHSRVTQGGILTSKQTELLDRVVSEANKEPEPHNVKIPHGPNWAVIGGHTGDDILNFTVVGPDKVTVTEVYGDGSKPRVYDRNFDAAADLWDKLVGHGFDLLEGDGDPPFLTPKAAQAEDPMIEVLRNLYRAAKQDRNQWLMDFAQSVAEQLKRGRPLSDKQQAVVDKNRGMYRLAIAWG